MDLAVDLAPRGKRQLVLRNPVMTASGTSSNALELAKRFDIDALGAIVSKGMTLRPRRPPGTSLARPRPNGATTWK